MTPLTFPVPVAGSTLNSVADPQIAGALNAILPWSAGKIDGVNVDPTLPGRRLVAESAVVVGPGVAAGANFVLVDGTLLPTASTTTKAIMWWFLDSSLLAVTGRTTQAIVRLAAATSGAPGVTLSGQLASVSFTAAGVNLTPVAGTTMGTPVNVAPGAGATAVAETPPFAYPPAGPYAPMIALSGASGASSATTLLWQLFVVNI